MRQPSFLVHGVNTKNWLSIGRPLYAVSPSGCRGVDNAAFVLPQLTTIVGTRPACVVPRSLLSFWGGSALAMLPTDNSQRHYSISTATFGKCGNAWNYLSGVAAVQLVNDALYSQNQNLSLYYGAPTGSGNATAAFTFKRSDGKIAFYYQDAFSGSELIITSSVGSVVTTGKWHILGYVLDVFGKTGTLFADGVAYSVSVSGMTPGASPGLTKVTFGGCDNDYSHGQIFGPQAHWTSLVSNGVMLDLTGNKKSFLSLFSM